MLGCHDTIESLTSQVYYKAVLIYVRLSWYNWKFDKIDDIKTFNNPKQPLNLMSEY